MQVVSQPQAPTYSIDMNWKGQFLTTVHIDFYQPTTMGKLSLGTAIVQILQPGLPGTVHELIQCIKDYPIDLLAKLDEVTTALAIIESGEVEFEGRIAILQLFEIARNQRGNKLSELFLSLILKGLRENLEVQFVLLQPCPTETDKMDASAMRDGIRRLESLYRRSGFRTLKERHLQTSHGVDVYYMYCNLNEVSATRR